MSRSVPFARVAKVDQFRARSDALPGLIERAKNRHSNAQKRQNTASTPSTLSTTTGSPISVNFITRDANSSPWPAIDGTIGRQQEDFTPVTPSSPILPVDNEDTRLVDFIKARMEARAAISNSFHNALNALKGEAVGFSD